MNFGGLAHLGFTQGLKSVEVQLPAYLADSVGERGVFTRPNLHCLLHSRCCWMGQVAAPLMSVPSWHYLSEESKYFWLLPGEEPKVSSLVCTLTAPKTHCPGRKIRTSYGYTRQRSDDHVPVSLEISFGRGVAVHACVHGVGVLSWRKEIVWVSAAFPLGFSWNRAALFVWFLLSLFQATLLARGIKSSA